MTPAMTHLCSQTACINNRCKSCVPSHGIYFDFFFTHVYIIVLIRSCIMVYLKKVDRVPCAAQQDLIAYPFSLSSLALTNPKFAVLPPSMWGMFCPMMSETLTDRAVTPHRCNPVLSPKNKLRFESPKSYHPSSKRGPSF